MRHKVPSPTGTIKFERFLDRWSVMLSALFGKVLDPGKHIGNVWCIHVPEGLKEVLWNKMNGAQVLGARYFGIANEKLDMGRICLCGQEMSLGHILVGCTKYNLQPLLSLLLTTLGEASLKTTLKTLHPDELGHLPWYPLLALQALEDNVQPPFKGLKKVNWALRETRPKREWLIGSYYWALWKWRMKEIHESGFRFIPLSCTDSMRRILSHYPKPDDKKVDKEDNKAPVAKTKLTDSAYN